MFGRFRALTRVGATKGSSVAVRIRMNDGINLVARIELEEFTQAYQSALKNDELLEIENGNGHLRRLNPVQILYFEDAEASDEPDQDPAPVPEGLRAP
jgi:hypothetical protein